MIDASYLTPASDCVSIPALLRSAAHATRAVAADEKKESAGIKMVRIYDCRCSRAQALTALGEELAAQSENGAAPCVRVLVEGKQQELDPVARDEIYRIAREALGNAFRHAKAQKTEAEITYGDSEFLLHVRDDGIGIAPEVTDQGARAGHWGLPGMRERAKSFGGIWKFGVSMEREQKSS